MNGLQHVGQLGCDFGFQRNTLPTYCFTNQKKLNKIFTIQKILDLYIVPITRN